MAFNFQTSESSETTLHPESQNLNGSGVMTREADSRFPKTKCPVQPGMIHVLKGFFLIPSVIFGVGSSKRPHRQGKNNKLCFVYLVHGKFSCFAEHQPE